VTTEISGYFGFDKFT